MKNLLEILKAKEPFELSENEKINYNAQDHPNHLTGIMGGGKKCACIYSVYAVNVKEDIAFTQARNVWGQILDEVRPLSQLIPYSINRIVDDLHD